MCLVLGGGLAGTRGVLEFVASSSHCSEGSEPVAELGTQSHLDCVVPAGRCWAQALVGQDRGAGVPSGVVGQDGRAVGVLVGYLACCFEGPRGLLEEVCAVGLSSDDLLQVLVGDQLLDLGFASGPAAHDTAFPVEVTSTVGEALICRIKASA